MTDHRVHTARCWPFRYLLAICWVLLFTGAAVAQPPLSIVKVEQDWELVVGTPEPDTDAPQVTCVLSPVGSVDSVFASFELNYQTAPDYLAGGVHLQIWDGETSLETKHSPSVAMLTTTGETVTWTEVMEVKNGLLTFDVVNGHSTTWGEFGGEGSLKFNVPTTLTDLNGYDPVITLRNSGVGYAGNRVQSLVLKRVRVYTSADPTTPIEDPTPRVVHPQN